MADLTAAPYKNLSSTLKALFEAKAAKGCTFSDIGKAIGRDEVWVAAVFYGQALPTQKDVQGLADYFANSDLTQNIAQLTQGPMNRGEVNAMPPTDPVIYRLYEGLLVYGYPIKAIIHEKFGDGIMSLIDCKVHVERKEDPKGDRVLLTFDGKFLSYATW